MVRIRFGWRFAIVVLAAWSAAGAGGRALCGQEAREAIPPARRALLVGIDTYESLGPRSNLAPPPGRRFRNLRGAAGDARALAEVLISRFGFSRGEVMVLADRAAGRAAILRGFERLIAESKSGDFALFYFAGHGSLVPNPASEEPDRLDESLVPADAIEGAPDLRDKELRRLLNRLLDRGALPTVILDSCHSGSAARGFPTGARPRALAPARSAVRDPAPYGPDPAERGALVLSAAQADSLAWETEDEAGMAHGAFSWALLRSLADAPAAEPSGETFERIRARLHADWRDQEPVLEGTETARRTPLFGTGAVSPPPRTLVAVERIDDDGQVILASGWADGLAPGSRLSWRSGSSPPVELEIVEVLGTGRAKARRLGPTPTRSAEGASPSAPLEIPSGTLLTVSGRPAAEGRRLTVWIPTWPGDFDPVLRWAQDLERQARAAGISWVGDPLVEVPTHVLRWQGSRWQIVSVEVRDLKGLPAAGQFLRDLPRGARLYVQLPLPEGMAQSLRIGPGAENDGIEPVTEPTSAAVLLAGRSIDGTAEFAWIRPDHAADRSPDGLPPATPWRRLGPAEDNWLRADLYHLRKLQGWLNLESPPEFAFGYQLALEPPAGSKLEPKSAALREGERYDLVLRLRPGFPADQVRPRHLYVFSIDSEGTSTLLFGLKSDSSYQPFGLDAPDGPASPPTSLVLGDQPLVEVTEPLGRDTYFLLTTDEPLANPGILNYRGFRKRGPPGAGPLEELLSLTGGTGRGRPKLAIPVAWSIERWSFNSIQREK